VSGRVRTAKGLADELGRRRAPLVHATCLRYPSPDVLARNCTLTFADGNTWRDLSAVVVRGGDALWFRGGRLAFVEPRDVYPRDHDPSYRGVSR
jgi:hypothetical protein